MDIQNAIAEWQGLLGPSQVKLGPQIPNRYVDDTSGYVRDIPAALKILDASCLQAVMRIAHQHKVPVYPISTGHNWGYGTALPAQDGCVILDLSELQQILHFDPELGVVTVEPGVTQGMLSDFLIAGNYPYLVPVTGAGPTCSLLGNALERGYGVTPYTDHFGATTDIEAVLPDGSLYRTALHEVGGAELARLFKWGIGPYTTGLFTQGGFGIVTRMSILLARKPACIKVCLFSLKDDSLLEAAVLSIRNILGTLGGTVGAINLMNQHRVLSMSAPYSSLELDSHGVMTKECVGALGKQYQIFPWTGFGTLYGSSRVVAAAQKDIKAALGGIATRLMFLTPERAQQLASLTRLIPGKFGRGLQGMTATLSKSLELVAGKPNETALPLAYWRNAGYKQGQVIDPAADGCGLTWYAPLVPMRPVDVREFVQLIMATLPKYGFEPLITFTTLSNRLFDSTIPIIFSRNDTRAVANAAKCAEELLRLGRVSGWFPYRVGVDAMKTLVAMQPQASSFQCRLRLDLDPDDIMAPGRYR